MLFEDEEELMLVSANIANSGIMIANFRISGLMTLISEISGVTLGHFIKTRKWVHSNSGRYGNKSEGNRSQQNVTIYVTVVWPSVASSTVGTTDHLLGIGTLIRLLNSEHPLVLTKTQRHNILVTNLFTTLFFTLDYC